MDLGLLAEARPNLALVGVRQSGLDRTWFHAPRSSDLLADQREKERERKRKKRKEEKKRRERKKKGKWGGKERREKGKEILRGCLGFWV